MTAYIDFSITVPFEGTYIEGIDNIPGHTGGYLKAPAGGIVYGTLAMVKRETRKSAVKFVERAIANVRNNEKQLIVCNDGHVLVVHFNDGWGYHIANENREHNYAGSSWGADNFEQCLQRARSHATECFGGVRWENRL